MKKICTLFLLLCVFGAAHAQRIVDLQVTLKSPLQGATITSGQLFQVEGVIRNLSTTIFKSTDTVMVGITMDGGPLIFVVNGQPVSEFPVTGTQLAQNDSLVYTWSNNLFFPATLNGAHQLCLVATVTNASDPIADNIAANNTSCANVTFAGGGLPSSVPGVTAEWGGNRVTSVHPLPADKEVRLDLELGSNSPVTVRIADLAGRTVLAADKSVLAKGTQTVTVPTAALPAGTYLYQVLMDHTVNTGKLVIAR